MSELMKTLESRYTKLRAAREPFMPWWKDLSVSFMPAKGRFFSGDKNMANRRGSQSLNNRGIMAARIFASGLAAGTTNPAMPWFGLKTVDSDLMTYLPIKEHLFQVEELIRDVMLQSNMYQVLPMGYSEFGAFGGSALLLDEDFKDVVRGYPYTVGEYMLGMSARNQVDTIYSERQMTVGQMVSRFGIKKVSTTVRSLYNNNQLEADVPLVHVIEPNDDRISGSSTAINMPWRSIYYEKGEKTILSISGYNEFPVVAPRYSVTAGDVYGTSCPGMIALGDNRQLQVEERRKAEGIDKQVNPPIQAPGSMRNTVVSTLPGGINFYTAMGGAEKIESLYNVNLNLNDLHNDILAVSDRIDEAFYVQLFQRLINSTRRDMTATEVNSIESEKMLMLGPVLNQQNVELNNPLISRIYSMLARGGLLPPAPIELEGQPLKVEYVSVLAQAQKMAGISMIEQVIGFVGNLSTVSPEAIDNLDVDEAINEYANIIGAAPKIIKSRDEVSQLRQQRADQQAQEQRIAMMVQGAESAKTASETPTGDGSTLLQDIQNAAGA